MKPCAIVLGTVIGLLLPGVAIGQVKSDEPIKSVRILGRVMDPTGAPLRDVAVVMRLAGSDDPRDSTKTSGTGEYTFLVVPHRAYELHFESPGFWPETKVLTAEKDTDVGTLALSVHERGGMMVLPMDPQVELASVEPIKTTLCDLLEQPQKFNGRMVLFRAEYISKFRWAGFVDDGCSSKLRVGVYHPLDDLRPQQGQYAFTTADDGNTPPERLTWKPIEPLRPVHLNEDAAYQAFREYAEAKFRWPDEGFCQDCPLYRISVSATGRFDYFETQTVAVRANPKTKALSYSAGDPNAPLMRLVLESVSDVAAIPIDPTVYSEPKRREISLEEAHDLVTALMQDRGNTKLPGFDLDSYKDSYYPQFQFFQAIFDNPHGSFNLGHYAVDPKTGDLWNGVICERMRSVSLTKLQRVIRIRIGLTQSDYRKAQRPGPMCE